MYALEQILESSQHFAKVHLLYDVACTLDRHLQVRFRCLLIKHDMECAVYMYFEQKQGRTDLLGYFKLSVPVFHSYGHKVDCQVCVSNCCIKQFTYVLIYSSSTVHGILRALD